MFRIPARPVLAADVAISLPGPDGPYHRLLLLLYVHPPPHIQRLGQIQGDRPIPPPLPDYPALDVRHAYLFISHPLRISFVDSRSKIGKCLLDYITLFINSLIVLRNEHSE